MLVSIEDHHPVGVFSPARHHPDLVGAEHLGTLNSPTATRGKARTPPKREAPNSAPG
jgi:hypothetical protein